MKQTFYFSLVLFILFSTRTFAQDALTNKSIISLSKAGLPSSIIINKMKTSNCTFDLSTDALIELKNNKVTDDVLNAMIDKQGKSNATGNAAIDNIISKLPQTGIYYLSPENGQYIKVDATIVTGTKTSSNLVGTIKSTSSLDGSEANLQTSSSAVFYFYFGDNAENKLSNNSASNTSYKNEFVSLLQSYSSTAGKSNEAFTPNDFKLIKLDRSRNTRSFESGRMSAYSGTSNGVNKNVEGFKYETIAPNLYKVYFPSGLPSGEFCFIYAPSIASGGVVASMSNNYYHTTDVKVFDFGVK